MADGLRFKCKNCGMKYDSREALIKHEKKFCTDSEYGNILGLEKKLHDLGSDNMNDPKLGMKDVSTSVIIIDQLIYCVDSILPKR